MPVTIRQLVTEPIKAHKRRIVYAVLALFCLALAQSAFLLAVKPLFGFLFADTQKELFAFRDLLPPQLARFAPGGIQRATIQLYLPILLVVASLIKSTTTYIYRYQQEALSLHVASHYRQTLFQRIVSQPFIALGRKEPAHWMSIIMNDVFYLQTRFSEIASSLVKDGVSLIASLVVIALYSPMTALVLLVIGPLLMIRLGTVSKRISRYAEAWQNDIAMLAAKVLDVRRRFGFIRSQKAEPLEAKIFAKQNSHYYETVRSSIALRASFSPLVEYIGFLLFAGIMALINYDQKLLLSDPTDMVAYLAAMAVLLKPMRNIGEQVTRYRETKGSLSASLEVLTQPMAEDQRQLPGPVDPRELGTVVIDRLVVGYKEDCPAINLDALRVPAASLTAVIGSSGSGKSTFAKTLAGLLPATLSQGAPELNDLILRCSYVSQFPFMFNETVRQNLCYGSTDNLPDSAIDEALKIADIWDDVASLPRGLDTVLGRVHSNLSGGQLQRLAIARGILQKKPLLVLDEATASVSEASEERIILALKEHLNAHNHTGIAITHRLRVLHLFDHIIWLADGKVKAQGTFASISSSAEFKSFAQTT